MDKSTKNMPQLSSEELEDLEWQQIEKEILELNNGDGTFDSPEDPWNSPRTETTKFRFSRNSTDSATRTIETPRLRPAQEAARAHRAQAAGSKLHSIDETPAADEPKAPSALKSFLSFLFQLACVFAASWLIVTFVGQRTVVDGDSMFPTLENGQSLWIDKLSYRFRDPRRFEIVVFPYAHEKDTYYIKRIIGLPGELVQVNEAGEILIDGEVLEENFGAETIYIQGLAAGEGVRLQENEYFVMGDNRNNSKDSRFDSVGPVHRDKLMGHVVWRLWPFAAFGPID